MHFKKVLVTDVNDREKNAEMYYIHSSVCKHFVMVMNLRCTGWLDAFKWTNRRLKCQKWNAGTFLITDNKHKMLYAE